MIAIGLFLAAVLILFYIADEIVLEKETYFDETVFFLFKNFIQHKKLNSIVANISNFASPIFIKIFSPLLVFLLFIFKQRKKALFLFLSSLGGLLLIVVLKNIFKRGRPPYPLMFTENGYSFPSGHATFSFIFYGAIAYLIWLADLPKGLKLTMMFFVITLSLVIGISRIYLRVHYPSDVFAGFCLGYSWLFLVVYFYRERFSFKN